MTDVLVPLALISDPKRFGGARRGDCVRGVPAIKDGKLVALAPPIEDAAKLVIPHLTEAHCHLDKCHTIARIGQAGGDLAHALEQQRADKNNWSEDDLRARASKGLNEAMANGCRTIRSHVDWGDTAAPPLSWSVLTEIAEETEDLQLSTLCGIDQWADPDFATKLGEILTVTEGVAGAFVHGHHNMQDGLRHIFETATHRGLMLDFHVDEGLGDLNGLEAIADAALATKFDAPILCGHAVSLIDRDESDFARIAEKCARARITICALPTSNLYLQGRRDGTPDRRGITRMRELRAAGVKVVVASDNVGDAFCPLGAHDPRAALGLACLRAHLDPPLGDWLTTITTDAAAALGRTPQMVDGAALDDLLTCDGEHSADLIAARTSLRPATQTLI